jgi:hypothetical protein
MAIRVKPFRSSTSGLTPPAPGIILAGSPDGRGATLGATLGVPAVENEVAVGTWSGSVSDRLSDTDSLMLEKIRDVWVNHSNWVLLGVGAEVGIEVMSKELEIDIVGISELSEGKTMTVLGMELGFGLRMVEGGMLGLISDVDSRGSLLTRGWVETGSLLTRVEEGGHPMPSRRHRSPVVVGDGGWVSAGSLLAGGLVETGSLLTGIEEGGQPMPSKRHRSPVVLGGGGWVETVSPLWVETVLLLAGEEGGQPIPSRRHRSPVGVGGWVETVLLLAGEEGGQPIPSRRHRSPVVGGWVSTGSLLAGGGWVEAGSLLVRVKEGGHPMPSKIHRSPDVGGGWVSTGSLLAGGGWVEAGSLLAGVEEGGHPIPSRIHRSPVVVGGWLSTGSLVAGGGWVEAGSLLVRVEEGGHPMPSRRHRFPVVVGGWVSVVEEGSFVWGGSLAEGECETSVDEGVSLDEVGQKSPRRPQSWEVEVRGSDVEGVGSGVLEDEEGGSVSEGEGDGSDGDEEGSGVSAGSAGKVTVAPLTIAETRPSGDWPRTWISSPSSMMSSIARRRWRAAAGGGYWPSNLFLWATDLLRLAGVGGRWAKARLANRTRTRKRFIVRACRRYLFLRNAAYGKANGTWGGPVEIINESKGACSVGLTL